MVGPRVALVHDRWVTLRGGERVFQGLMRMFPHADCFALVGSPRMLPPDPGAQRMRFSFMRLLPLSRRYYRAFLPVYPLAARSLDLRRYDLVISSSSGFCHAVRTAGHHICYCHTPNRYAWNELEMTVNAQASALKRALLRRTLTSVRRFDYAAAQRVTRYVANSTAVQGRIAEYYGRTSTVVHPFIDIGRYQPLASQPDHASGFYLVVSELLPYKRVDIAVEACTRMGRPLVVVGVGPELERLKRIAGPMVRFAGRVSEQDLARLYAECLALLQCGEEDFGMAALEAQAAGRPVIAYGVSGALETVRDGVTGRLFSAQTTDDLAAELSRFDVTAFDVRTIRQHAEQFDESRFRARMMRVVEETLRQRDDGQPDGQPDGQMPAEDFPAGSSAPAWPA